MQALKASSVQISHYVSFYKVIRSGDTFYWQVLTKVGVSTSNKSVLILSKYYIKIERIRAGTSISFTR